MQAAKLLAASGTASKLYAEDVFSAYTYTGNGSTQTITNGIDLAGKGGMVWTKDRSVGYDNCLIDTAIGTSKYLRTNNTGAAVSDATEVTGFTSTGYTLGSSSNLVANNSGTTYIGWTFRRAEKFFDVVTYTGTGSARTVAHSLGQAPGMIIVKETSTGRNWTVYHQSLGATKYLLFTTAAEATATSIWNDTAPTATEFTVGTSTNTNESGGTYVAYLFAHDTSTDGLIQCGSLPTSGSVTLGWEPQFVLWKDAPSGWWYIYDTARGFTTLTSGVANGASLNPNNSNAESFSTPYVSPNPTGFTSNGATGATSIYLAIRRPNKPPTTGTQVYNAIARTGTGAAATVTGVGFAPDLVHIKRRTAVDNNFFGDRLRGSVQALYSDATAAEAAFSNGVVSLGMDGMSLGTGTSVNATDTIINHFFKRAPGVFDVVCYTGTGSAHTVSHGLGAVPELMIVKKRSATDAWYVYVGSLGATKELLLNMTLGEQSDGAALWNSAAPTSSVFSLGTDATVNQSTGTFVTYLFATLAGISKVGSYTGTATTNAINCGFTTGARFVMIKRTDSTGDWYVWDTTRGIIAGNDPYLLLNSTAAENTTTDYIDPSTSGFELSSTAPAAINASGGTFIYLAFS